MAVVIDARTLGEFKVALAEQVGRLGQRERALFDLTLTLASSAGPEAADFAVPDVLAIPDMRGLAVDPVAYWLIGALSSGLYGAADSIAVRSGLSAVRVPETRSGHPSLAVMASDDDLAQLGPVVALVEDGTDEQPQGAVRAVLSPRQDRTRGPVLAVTGPHPDDALTRAPTPPRKTPLRASIGPKPEDPRNAELNPSLQTPYDPDTTPRANALAGWGFLLAMGPQAGPNLGSARSAPSRGRGETLSINGDALASFGKAIVSLAASSPAARASLLLLTLRAKSGSLTWPVTPGLLGDGATDPLPLAVLGDAEASARTVHIIERGDQQWQRAVLRRLG